MRSALDLGRFGGFTPSAPLNPVLTAARGERCSYQSRGPCASRRIITALGMAHRG